MHLNKQFKGKMLILGCGSVAQCTIPILLKDVNMSPANITVMDMVDNKHLIKNEIKKGVNYVLDKVDQDNYLTLLPKYLSSGDFLLDLSYDVNTCALLEWCHNNNVLYVNASIDTWKDGDEKIRLTDSSPTALTLYERYKDIHKLVDKWKDKNGATAIMDHGANPGLVSHFTKQALVDMANRLIKEKKITKSKITLLENSLKKNEFAKLAQLLGVKTIHISERDSQIVNKPKEVNEFVNTWSINGFIEEGLAPAELGWGTHEKELPKNSFTHKSGTNHQILLATKGCRTWVRSWVPSGEIMGMVIRHGEAYSIPLCLTVKENNKVVYRPTVHYAYCPCDGALNSLHELAMRHYIPQEKFRILENEIISGKDELGCLLMGHEYKSWWIGSILDIETARKLVPNQNATTVQVAAGVVAAILYAINYPNLGFCVPDDLAYDEILEYVKPYLGEFISIPVDWSPRDNGKAFMPFGKVSDNKTSSEDEWQFSTFLVTA